MEHIPSEHAASPDGSTIERLSLSDGGRFPNNPRLAVLVYRGAFGAPQPAEKLASMIERAFAVHGWSSDWRDSVYDYHHYHSTAHEVLGCYQGHARLQLGGPEGITLELAASDVLVLPAGTAHKSLTASADFSVVGAYAEGREYDMCTGEAGERPRADQRIRAVPMPECDPVFGGDGPLLQHWRSASDSA